MRRFLSLLYMILFCSNISLFLRNKPYFIYKEGAETKGDVASSKPAEGGLSEPVDKLNPKEEEMAKKKLEEIKKGPKAKGKLGEAQRTFESKYEQLKKLDDKEANAEQKKQECVRFLRVALKFGLDVAMQQQEQLNVLHDAQELKSLQTYLLKDGLNNALAADRAETDWRLREGKWLYTNSGDPAFVQKWNSSVDKSQMINVAIQRVYKLRDTKNEVAKDWFDAYLALKTAVGKSPDATVAYGKLEDAGKKPEAQKKAPEKKAAPEAPKKPVEKKTAPKVEPAKPPVALKKPAEKPAPKAPDKPVAKAPQKPVEQKKVTDAAPKVEPAKPPVAPKKPAEKSAPKAPEKPVAKAPQKPVEQKKADVPEQKPAEKKATPEVPKKPEAVAKAPEKPKPGAPKIDENGQKYFDSFDNVKSYLNSTFGVEGRRELVRRLNSRSEQIVHSILASKAPNDGQVNVPIKLDYDGQVLAFRMEVPKAKLNVGKLGQPAQIYSIPGVKFVLREATPDVVLPDQTITS